MILIGIIAGFWIVPTVARFSPVLVNGLLLLILVGIILGNSDRWTPILAAFGKAVTDAMTEKTAEKAKTPSPVGKPVAL